MVLYVILNLHLIMVPSKYNSNCVRLLTSIESRQAKDGKVFFYVEIWHSHDVGMLGFRFESLASAYDFIKSNLSYN